MIRFALKGDSSPGKVYQQAAGYQYRGQKHQRMYKGVGHRVAFYLLWLRIRSISGPKVDSHIACAIPPIANAHKPPRPISMAPTITASSNVLIIL